MNKFDTIKLNFPIHGIKNINHDLLIKIVEDAPGKEDKTLYRLRRDSHILGIAGLQINYNRGCCTLECSAKVLKSDYKNLIHKGNYMQFVDSLNDCNLIEVDPDVLLYESNIYRIDVCKNLHLAKNFKNVITMLRSRLLQDNKYFIKTYQSGLELISKNKSDKFRIILYLKYGELKKACNRELLKYIDIENFVNVLRIEANIKTWKMMRNLFDIPQGKNPSLADMFHSNENVLKNLFDPYLFTNDVDERITISKVIYNGRIKFGEKLKKAGEISILDHFNDDLTEVDSWIQSFVKTNPYKYKTEFRQVVVEKESDWLNEYAREVKCQLEHNFD